MFHRQDDFHQARDACRGFGLSDIRFHRADDQRIIVGSPGSVYRF